MLFMKSDGPVKRQKNDRNISNETPMNWIRNCVTLLLLCIPNVAAATTTDEIMEYDTSTGWYQNYNNGRTFDWAPGEFKGECIRYTTGALGGLSGDYYRHMMIHGINCTEVAPTYFDVQSFSVSLPVWTFPNAYLPITISQPQGWDWDLGYQKFTCGSNQWVSGVAQNTDGSGIAQVQCAGSAANVVRDDNKCFVTTMGVDYNGTNHGSDSNSGDWDPGYQKGDCGGDAIAGISRNVPDWDPKFGGAIHALLCCPQWRPQNASQGGRVAAVSRGDTNLEVFSIDPDGAVSHTFWNGGAWGSDMMSPMGTLARAVPMGGPNANAVPGRITAVSSSADNWDVFFPKGTHLTGSLQHAYWHTGMGEYGWDYPANNVLLGGGISAVSRAPGLMEVFYVGNDYSFQHVYWDGNWHGPDQVIPGVTVGGSVYVNSPVAAISRGLNLMDVFYVSMGGSVCWLSYGPAGWSARPTIISGTDTANDANGLAVLARDPNFMELFFVTPSGSLQYANWQTGSSTFAGPWSLTGANAVSPTSDVAAVSRVSNVVEVFTTANDGTVQDTYDVDGYSWQGPTALPTNNGTPPYTPPRSGGGIAAISRMPGATEVPYTDQNGDFLQDLFYTDSGGWQQQQLPATTDPTWPTYTDFTLNGGGGFPGGGVPTPGHLASGSMDDSPPNWGADWTNDLEGSTHNDYVVYFANTTPGSILTQPDAHLCKWYRYANLCIYGNLPITDCAGMLVPNAWHYGGISSFGGYLFLPVQMVLGPRVVGIAKDSYPTTDDAAGTSYANSYAVQAIPLGDPTNAFDWLAVNPRDGKLYTSSPTADTSTLVTYRIIFPTASDSSFHLVRDVDVPVTFLIKNVQAGVFTPNGHLYVTSNDLQATSNSPTGGVYGIDTSGNVRVHLEGGPENTPPGQFLVPYDYANNDDELEGIDYIDNDAPNPVTGLQNANYPGQLHVQCLNNHKSGDDGLSYYHYRVAPAARPHI